MSEMKRYLVTGGSGFIGSAVIAILLAEGHTVVNLDLKSPDDPGAKNSWVECDIRSRPSIESIVPDFDPNVIIHLASDTDISFGSIDKFDTTITGTSNLLDLAAELKNLSRFVHTSTQFVVRPGVAVRSDTEFAPYTIYGQAKARSELLVRDSTVPWTIVRPAVIWGPKHPSFATAIWKYIAMRLYLQPSSSGAVLRSYGYVENTARQIAVLSAADLASVGRRVFYLADGALDQSEWVDAFSIALTGRPARRVPKELLHCVAVIGEGMKLVGLKPPIDLGRFFRITTSSEVDINKTVLLTGGPEIPFSEGVRRTVKWLSQVDSKRFKAVGKV